MAGVVAGLLLAACGGGGDGDGDGGGGGGEPGGRAGGGGAERSAALPGPVCERLDALDERRADLTAPDAFALDEAALADVLAGRRRALGELADAATEAEVGADLAGLLEDWVAGQEAVDAAMVDGWDAERARLAAVHRDRWVEAAVGDAVTGGDGDPLDLAAFWTASRVAYERLVVGCRAPELAELASRPVSSGPADGRLVYFRPAEDATGEGGTGTLQVATAGGSPEELVVSERPGDDMTTWVPTGMIDVAPGDAGHFLVNVRSGGEYAMVEVDAHGTIVAFAQRSAEGPIDCPGWDRLGRRLVAVLGSPVPAERHVVLIDLTGATPSRRAPLPFATAGCADFVADDRLVVSEAALSLDDVRGVWAVGLDGSAPEELYRAEGCATQVGGVNPAGTHVAVAQNCDDPLESGVVVVDLTTGGVERVATGLAALPKWSPGGQWLAFGYSPPGSDEPFTAWVARADGRRLHPVTDEAAWFPSWLPPA